MIAYFAHELSDPNVQRRVRMLKAAGEEVTLIGFERRAYPRQEGAEAPTLVLGRTQSGRLLSRVFIVLGAIPKALALRAHWERADAILARNLEMLVIACVVSALTRSKVRIVYECLDIHRMMHGRGIASRALRWIERLCLRGADLVVVSSPDYGKRHFHVVQKFAGEILLVENKAFAQGDDVTRVDRCGAPWRLLWCGNLRCRKSLALLVMLAQRPDVEIILRGVVARDQIPDFDEIVTQTDRLAYAGSYRMEELPAHVAEADFIWTGDYFNAGGDAGWSLSNRLYDGLRNGAVPLALASNAACADWLDAHNVGVVLSEPAAETLPAFFASLSPGRMSDLRAAVKAVPRDAVETSLAEARAIAARIAGRTMAPPDATVLVVIPCLNEAAHLPRVLGDLVSDPRAASARIVVADGGSADQSRAIVSDVAAAHANVVLLDNPGRTQSAGINLAVARHGGDVDFILRMDAHAIYPRDFIDRLLAAQAESGADSVTVSMQAIAPSGGCFQRAVAAAQNSALGTGGSAHRKTGHRRFVDHGHHALMRKAAFVAAGGYDETFPQNQDAELDARLVARGGRILLAGDIVIDYIPRASPSALFRQYFNFGKGRARTMRKHRLPLKLRQTAPLFVAPAMLAAAFAPFSPWAAAPCAVWLGACLGYGAWLGVRAKHVCACGAGAAAAIMHAAWSLGYWLSLAQEFLGAQGAGHDAGMIEASHEARAPADR